MVTSTTKLNSTLALLGILATTTASATDLSGSEWNFAYQGHYAIANADISNLGLGVGSIAGLALSAQLALLTGTIAGSGPISFAQTSTTSLTTSRLTFDAQGGALLLPAVKTLLYNALAANDGVYTGRVDGSTLSLVKAPVLGASADGLGIVDTRIAGVGVVVDLRAVLPSNGLTGTIDKVDASVASTYGPRAEHVTGISGVMDTIGLQARATVYALGLGGLTSTSTGYVDVGAVQTVADSWSLARPGLRPVPEPASFATLGLAVIPFLRRKRQV